MWFKVFFSFRICPSLAPTWIKKIYIYNSLRNKFLLEVNLAPLCKYFSSSLFCVSLSHQGKMIIHIKLLRMYAYLHKTYKNTISFSWNRSWYALEVLDSFPFSIHNLLSISSPPFQYNPLSESEYEGETFFILVKLCSLKMYESGWWKTW